ncbi:SCO family protein [Streptomyces megasporus]|uniref:SCO family protein n=1 Tax=Streptomyces megasporus TaxID=44060 RepID=UPI000B286584|nr:SCO family protein [Streptomyces megasporus]
MILIGSETTLHHTRALRSSAAVGAVLLTRLHRHTPHHGMQDPAAVTSTKDCPYRDTELEHPFPQPDPVSTDTSGKPLDPREQTAGKTMPVFFGYTNCPDVCPSTMGDISMAPGKQPTEVRDAVEAVFLQNLLMSGAILVTLVPLAATGLLGLAAVVATHELAEVLVIGNGIRAGRKSRLPHHAPLRAAAQAHTLAPSPQRAGAALAGRVLLPIASGAAAPGPARATRAHHGRGGRRAPRLRGARLSGWPIWAACWWVAAEAVRSRVPLGGFPWGRLAFSQADSPALGWASLGSAPRSERPRSPRRGLPRRTAHRPARPPAKSRRGPGGGRHGGGEDGADAVLAAGGGIGGGGPVGEGPQDRAGGGRVRPSDGRCRPGTRGSGG